MVLHGTVDVVAACCDRRITQMIKHTAGHDAPGTEEIDKIMEMKNNVCVGPFQAEILKGRVA